MRNPEERPATDDSDAVRRRLERPTKGSSDDELDVPPSLLVVSNRQPYRHEYDTSSDGVGGGDGSGTALATTAQRERTITVDEPTGGLTAGLDPVLQRANGTWIAWGDGEADREVTDENDCVAVPPGEGSYTLRRLWLSEEAVDAYYYGFSNRVLWPLCHELTDLIEHREGDRDWYRTVNRRFATAVAEHATDETVVWLQDYHLGYAPALIRESVPDSTTIAQFWHIPWPEPGAFEHCPGKRELLRGLLGNDLLSFHVDRYATSFLECVERFVPAATVDSETRRVEYDGRTIRVDATPMGVDARKHDHNARAVDISRWRSLRESYGIPEDCAIGVGVDRLDYTKGIPERLAAVERLFEHHPEWRERFAFIQKATPSRTDVPAYARLGDRVRSEVDRINDRFATDDWRPIVYTDEFLPRDDLCTLYRRADVTVVSPLFDGMNLVAQEFVASNVEADGSLVLSEHAGAHEQLGEFALTIDPRDTDQFADTIASALSMSDRERRRRMTALRDRVFANDLDSWMASQFDQLNRLAANRRPSKSRRNALDSSRDELAPDPPRDTTALDSLRHE
ncbi:alpha,alpha-trehalose-phosphate synthase (UDP-forming) [Natrononativus amylolyticus]|uniref:alpha,alpha-trehalose-phosphate synthase (UDP-forming) n=1 Tax=Natrononativus amylolyticus TaxID=2963434 RepID=UPI0020CF9BBC|nr:trehalose-6-phosphate synthase [Natrononativus amylolyticus]